MTNTMKNTTTFRASGHATLSARSSLLLALAANFLAIAGCGPDFDPASLIKNTRVLGARVEVAGSPDRATPAPGETANVTWLVTSPDGTPPLRWAFAACVPSPIQPANSPGCMAAPLALFNGATSPPRISMTIPAATALGDAGSVVLYGEICAGVDAAPVFDPQSGMPSCTGGRGTTVSLTFPLQLGPDANHNPAADHAFTLDGQTWPRDQTAGDPCSEGPRVAAGSKGHVIGDTIDGSDRESYTALAGDPPVATPTRESLQISQFTTAGKLKSQFSFVEATDARTATTVDVTWDAPDRAEVQAGGTIVTFTFVTRDNRGGASWTTRALCVTQ